MCYKRVLTIQDISCFGQCSLTVALPVISACGVETCVLTPYFCDFRWGITEFWTPWYNSAKIFRQVIQNDWRKPIENLTKYLSDWK